MIESLHLKNWQLHKDFMLPLGRLTVLTGDNDAGKSSALRALKWLALGEWDGKAGDYVTWGEERCEVTAVVDGEEAVRVRDKETNSYLIGGQEYKAFGMGIPQAASSLFRLTRSNFQDQDDPAYWLTLNAGQAASALNEIFQLTKIDEVTAAVAAELRQARDSAKVGEERLESLEKEVKSLAWVDSFEESLSIVESLARELEELTSEVEESQSLIAEWEEALRYEKTAGGITSQGDKILTLAASLEELDEQISTVRELLSLGGEICQLEKRVVERTKKLDKLLERCPLCQRTSPKS